MKEIDKIQSQIQQRAWEVEYYFCLHYYKKYRLFPDWDFTAELGNDKVLQQMYFNIEKLLTKKRK